MEREESSKLYGLKPDLIKKYGIHAYLLIQNIIDINNAEKLLENSGFTVKRITDKYIKTGLMFSEIYYQDKLVGEIDLQGFPSIMFYKRKRKLVSLIKENDLIMKPIKGVHRILDWHTVKGNMHCLAGGETVLHCIPTIMTEELIEEWIIKLKIQSLVQSQELPKNGSVV